MFLYIKNEWEKNRQALLPPVFIVLLFLADHVLRVESTVELLLGEDAVLEDNVVN